MSKRYNILLMLFAFALCFFESCDKTPEIINLKDDLDAGSNELDDFEWDSTGSPQILLRNNAIAFYGEGATVAGSCITIHSEGTYIISGELDNGKIVVDTKDKGDVILILSGVDVRSKSSSPLCIENATQTIIELAEGTQNFLTDAEFYIDDSEDDDGPNAALFSKDDLIISGLGTLTVTANFNDGISSKDALTIRSGTINVTAVDDGIRGKDFLFIEDGNITIKAGGDGLKSDNDELPEKGFIKIESGKLDIISAGDAIAAKTDVVIEYAEINIVSGGGSTEITEAGYSTKGIKATTSIVIYDGIFNINSSEDAINTNKMIKINGGIFTLLSKDDGIHSDSCLLINGGDIKITECYEGLESAFILFNDGNLDITSANDGINVAGGADESGEWNEIENSSGSYFLYIKGGDILINSNGDGIDVNGFVEMTGGNVVVYGPEADDNSPLDYDLYFSISGGYLLASGSSRMAKELAETSTQNSVLLNFETALTAGTITNIQNIQGVDILTFAPQKKYQSVVFSCPELKDGDSYNVYNGGFSTGTLVNGIYTGGTYTFGTKYAVFTISAITTLVEEASE